MPKYAIHVILIQVPDDEESETDILEEDEVVGCLDDYATYEAARQDYNKVKRG